MIWERRGGLMPSAMWRLPGTRVQHGAGGSSRLPEVPVPVPVQDTHRLLDVLA